jgi:hypothetical protein
MASLIEKRSRLIIVENRKDKVIEKKRIGGASANH